MSEADELIAGVRIGEVLAGKYRVDEVLGIGGMGVVVAAHHIQLDERVAIKFLLPEMLMSSEAVGRFAREARAAVKIKSQHVVRVFDVGTLENGAPYMVMEFLEGSDLSAWLKERGALPPELAVQFVLESCEALAAAHALGIVHRDLKPGNLFCVRHGDGQESIKLLDFGISKAATLSGDMASATKTSAVMGSPLYMSPEQMQSARTVDARTDIWALGVVLYELLSNQAPFQAESFPELCVAIATRPHTPLRQHRPQLPPGLIHAVEHCLEKDRERRYQSVAELALALQDFAPLRSRSVIEKIVGLQQPGLRPAATMGDASIPHTGPGAVGGTVAEWGQLTSARSSAGRTALTVAVPLLLLAAVGAYFLFRSQGATPPSELPTAAVAAAPAPPPPSPSPSPSPAIAPPPEPAAVAIASSLPQPEPVSSQAELAPGRPAARRSAPAPAARPTPAAVRPVEPPPAAAPARPSSGGAAVAPSAPAKPRVDVNRLLADPK